MHTQDKPRNADPGPQLDRPRRSRRSRTVAAVVTALAAATLTIAAVVSDGREGTPSEPPVAPAGQVAPDTLPGVSEGIHSVDG